MNKKFIKLSLVFGLVFSLFSISLVAQNDAIIEMADKSVSENDRFVQARLEFGGEGLFNLVDAQLLDKKYGYETNKDVKAEVDKEIDNLLKSNPDILKSYPGVSSVKELLTLFGNVLEIQRSAYAKDRYIKEFVTHKSLTKLYNARAGELTSYFIIRVNEADFDDVEAYSSAIIDIETKLASAKEDNVLSIFEELAKKYPGSDSDPSGEKTGVAREEVDADMLKKLDSFKYLGFNKEALSDDTSTYFILKTDEGKRLSFEQSKERLTTLQFDNAKEKNQYLEMFLLTKLRKENDISFKAKSDQRIYDLTTKEVISGYNSAKGGAN